MRFTLLSLCLFLAGCTQSSQPEIIAPTPAAIAPPALLAPLDSPTVLIPVATPTRIASPRRRLAAPRQRQSPQAHQDRRSVQRQTRAPRANRQSSRFTREEIAYIASTRQMEAILFDNASPDDPDAAFSPQFYGNVIRARAFFKNVPAPPRFAAADRMMGEGLKQSLDALTERQIAIEMGLYDAKTAEGSLQKMKDGGRLFDRGFLQVTGSN